MEFYITLMARENIAPRCGYRSLQDFYQQQVIKEQNLLPNPVTMKKTAINLSILTVTFLVLLGIVYWIESEKELRILSSMMSQGESIEEVQRLLETGELLWFEKKNGVIEVSSNFNLNSIHIVVALTESNTVEKVDFVRSINLEKVAAFVGAMFTFLLVLFQCALALGFPLGEWAWGGFHKELPKSLRRSSAISALILTTAFLAMSSILGLNILPLEWSVYLIAGCTVMFLLSVFGNLASVSKKEKMLMIPVSIVLFLTYFTVTYANM